MINLPQAGCPLTLLAAATQPPNQTKSFTTSISSLTILVMEGSLGALFLPLILAIIMVEVAVTNINVQVIPHHRVDPADHQLAHGFPHARQLVVTHKKGECLAPSA